MDFNGMSIDLGLFYAKRLRNHVHRSSNLSIYFCELFFNTFFAYGPIDYESF